MKNDRELLKEANELIRSFNCVIERKGLETNWDALEKQTKRVLKEQHELKLFSLPSINNSVCDLYKKECMGDICSVTPFPEKCQHLKKTN